MWARASEPLVGHLLPLQWLWQEKIHLRARGLKGPLRKVVSTDPKAPNSVKGYAKEGVGLGSLSPRGLLQKPGPREKAPQAAR